ncbi:hypothetical protein WN943_019730 [Citrus x changshan-huyou]
MRSRGPSPVVPSVMVGVLGFVIFGPTLLSLLEYVLLPFQTWEEGSGTFMVLLLLLSMLVLVHLLSSSFPTLRFSSSPTFQQSSSSGFDSDGFGFGSLLLILLFLVLYHLMNYVKSNQHLIHHTCPAVHDIV